MKSKIERVLESKFMEILNTHGNAVWAIDTLDWLVYLPDEQFSIKYNDVSKQEQREIDEYFIALRQLHGGK